MTCDPAAARPQPAAGKPHCPSLQDGCDSPDVCRADGECHYTKTPLAGRARPQPAAAEVEAVAQEATEDESLQARYKALARCYVAQGDLCRELLAQISALRPDTQTAAADVKTAALDLWAKLDTEIDPPGVLDHEQAVKIIGAWLRDNGSALRPATLADVPAELLTADQVLAEVEEYCTTKGNPTLAPLFRQHYEKRGNMAHAVLVSLGLEPVRAWRRLTAAQEKPDTATGDT